MPSMPLIHRTIALITERASRIAHKVHQESIRKTSTGQQPCLIRQLKWSQVQQSSLNSKIMSPALAVSRWLLLADTHAMQGVPTRIWSKGRLTLPRLSDRRFKYILTARNKNSRRPLALMLVMIALSRQLRTISSISRVVRCLIRPTADNLISMLVLVNPKKSKEILALALRRYLTSRQLISLLWGLSKTSFKLIMAASITTLRRASIRHRSSLRVKWQTWWRITMDKSMDSSSMLTLTTLSRDNSSTGWAHVARLQVTTIRSTRSPVHAQANKSSRTRRYRLQIFNLTIYSKEEWPSGLMTQAIRLNKTPFSTLFWLEMVASKCSRSSNNLKFSVQKLQWWRLTTRKDCKTTA